MTDGRISTASQFQFTPPRGGKPGERTKPPAPILISIHAPARGQTHTDGTYGLDLSDFNSRPREGANGVLLQRSRTRPEISIHAPARGQTGNTSRGVEPLSHFNSRPREGANGFGFESGPLGDLISIHAPARGQTMTDGRILTASQFQFTPPRGGKRPERRAS